MSAGTKYNWSGDPSCENFLFYGIQSLLYIFVQVSLNPDHQL